MAGRLFHQPGTQADNSMAKVAVLVPSQELCNLAQPLVGTFPSITLMTLEYIKTSQAESRARELERQGCDLIVARGVQARIIKQSVKLPVVEISVTLQELASVMLELKSELALPCPRIGLIGVANMFSDTSRFNELFGIELKLYMVRQNEELANAVSQAQADGCVGVIGGDIVCETARQKKLAYKYIPTGSESVHNALNFASRVGYAIDLEKHNSAEINALLNYTFNGIIQVDSSGVIRRVNRIGYSLLGQASSTLLGCSIYDALPNLNRTMLEDALLRGKEAYSFLLDINHKGVVVNIAPILVDSQIEGAVLTFQEGQRLIDMDSEMRRELYQRGFVARYNFDNIICDDPETQALFELAKRISKFSAPILLTGETGSGKNLLAQCIHNESLLRKNAFVTIDCSAWLPETLDNMLFGNYTVRKDSSVDSYAEMAQDGTLYLSHVEMLPLETQYKLLCLIRGRFLHNGPSRPVAANVRIIASSTVSLIARVEKGEFRSDLYYALSVLSLEMLPLRRHRGDILGWTAFYLDEWQEKYKRYVHLTQGAQRYLQEYEWPGNLDQLNSVCERLVLLTQKRNIDEVFLRQQLEQIAPRTLPGTEQIVLYKDQKAVEIAALLKKHPEIQHTVSATTRTPREGEKDGINYHFMSVADFEDHLAHDQIVEHTKYCENYYGTLRSEIEGRMKLGIPVILVIEVEGAGNIKKMYPGATTIFVLPPDMQELERRLRCRGTEDEETIQRRLKRAETEIANSVNYDEHVVNVEVDSCAESIYSIIQFKLQHGSDE